VIARTAIRRRRVAEALERRAVRERLVLSLLVVEHLRPIEVADALGISVRQVERTVTAFMSGLRRSLAQPASRSRTRAFARLRKAA
jgi:DNA-directed RNA polymerase specialized sigma24 family protein